MIQKAKIKDRKAIIDLLMMAMGEIAFSLSGTQNLSQTSLILQNFFKQKSNRLSHENIHTYSIDGQIVGAICHYDGSLNLDIPFENRLHSLGISSHIQKEALDNEFYIDSIATKNNFRNQGIATKLIQFSAKMAKNLNFGKISLLVDEQKTQTKLYYEKLGFKPKFTKQILSDNYIYMTKDLI